MTYNTNIHIDKEESITQYTEYMIYDYDYQFNTFETGWDVDVQTAAALAPYPEDKLTLEHVKGHQNKLSCRKALETILIG
eukprot:15365578-Ditylum_brightwellii.AAC.1